MVNKTFFNIRSAYGQLILLIFLPISVLAIIGTGLVYLEIMNATKHEQQALAQAILIRYQPIIREQLPEILINQHAFNGQGTDIHEQTTIKQAQKKQVNSELQTLLFSVQTENELQRIAIIDQNGQAVASAGFNTFEPWNISAELLTNHLKSHISSNHQKNKQSSTKHVDYLHSEQLIRDIHTKVGTAYGLSLGEVVLTDNQLNDMKQHASRFYPKNKHHIGSYWLFVDMDNQPIKIAQYRIALVLAITGLLTILLLLLALNIYSRRWLEPIYQIRLYLQGTTIDTLKHPLVIKSDGELQELQFDLVNTLEKIYHNFQDLQEHAKQTEEDLQRAFDEMEMQNIAIRDSRDKAISTSEAKSAFLANISHELRTPLNSIDGFSNLLARQGNLTAEQDLYIQTIRKSSAHLLALVNDVLDFSKIEAGKLVLDSHEFNLYDTIYEVVDMLSPVASEKNLRMGVLIYNDVPLTIIGDALRMKQVLTNIVANAIKFTDVGDVLVKVTLEDNRDNFLTISVQDSGRGVADADRNQLFKSFSQVDPSITRQYGGTGLGLVISKQLTEMMGGNIGYEDNAKANIASSGSTFWFSMPANVDVLEVNNAGDINLPRLINRQINHHPEQQIQVLIWINHAATIQLLNASLQALPIQITHTNSLASTLDTLKEEGQRWDWVIVDSNTNDSNDEMTALLKQIRLHYQGKLAVYGYQVALDNQLLSRYKAHSLHEPLDKRKLYQLLDNKKSHSNTNQAETPRWQNYRILAVDDHLPNLLVLEALLSEQGVEVITANSGFDAIEIISKQVNQTDAKLVDLIFMDMQMPRMSGQQASEQIRKIESKAPRIPIIALTAHGMADERDNLIKSGIDDYVGKPISQPQLLQILQKWLGKKAKVFQPIKNQGFDKTIDEDIEPTTAFSTISNRHSKTLNAASHPLPTNLEKNTLEIDALEIDALEIHELAVIDWQDALERSANKPDLASKLIVMMRESIPHDKTTLEQAWLNQNLEQLAQITHRILGASRYTGVPQLRYTSQVLDNKCVTLQSTHNKDKHTNPNPNQDTLNQPLHSLQTDYQALITALDNLATIDLSPWSQLRYHQFDEDDMTWKMI